METIAFIGLGNLGLPMAINLVKAGHRVLAYDVVRANLNRAIDAGAAGAADAAEASAEADVIITMVPSGKEVRQVFLEGGVVEKAKAGSLFIDCSTTDIESARVVKKAALDAGHEMIDAPVSGGYGRAGGGADPLQNGKLGAAPWRRRYRAHRQDLQQHDCRCDPRRGIGSVCPRATPRSRRSEAVRRRVQVFRPMLGSYHDVPDP